MNPLLADLAAALGPETTAEPAEASAEAVALPAVAVQRDGGVLVLPEAVAARLDETGAALASHDEITSLLTGAAEAAGATLTVDGEPTHVILLAGEAERPPAIDPDSLRGVPVRVWAELGRTRLPIGRAVGLAPGTVVELDRSAEDPVDLYVSGRHFARGALVLVDGEWAVEVLEVLNQPVPPSTTPVSP